MSDFLVNVPRPLLPTEITTLEDEKEYAKALVSVEVALRELEAKRKKIAKPQFDAFKAVNEQAKEASAPLEEMKSAVQGMMERYRQSPEVQGKLAALRNHKRINAIAGRDGDIDTVNITAEMIATTDVPLSLKVGKYDIRYREGVVIESVMEDQLPDRYFKKVIDEAAIKADIESLGFVRGVMHKWTYVPTVYSKKSSD